MTLSILIQDAAFAESVELVELKKSEIVLVYANGLLIQVLEPGRYTFWKAIANYEFTRADLTKIEITQDISRAVLTGKIMSPYVRSYTVESYEKALLFVDGKFIRQLESGAYFWWQNNLPILVGKADMRQQQVEINGQEILTSDKATLR